jgi:hypothetical protein
MRPMYEIDRLLLHGIDSQRRPTVPVQNEVVQKNREKHDKKSIPQALSFFKELQTQGCVSLFCIEGREVGLTPTRGVTTDWAGRATEDVVTPLAGVRPTSLRSMQKNEPHP